VEPTAEITHLPATHVQATALAKSIDRAIERWVEAGPSLAPDAAMQILNEETRSAFNR
jgi:hypothetical protein